MTCLTLQKSDIVSVDFKEKQTVNSEESVCNYIASMVAILLFLIEIADLQMHDFLQKHDLTGWMHELGTISIYPTQAGYMWTVLLVFHFHFIYKYKIKRNKRITHIKNSHITFFSFLD